MCKVKLWVRGQAHRHTDTQKDKHINTITRPGLKASRVIFLFEVKMFNQGKINSENPVYGKHH